jgi:hypothetical protein
MSFAGTAYVWDGAEWLPTAAGESGGGGSNPVDGYGDEPEMLVEYLFTGGVTTGWTLVESWSQSPTDYQYSAGSGSGYTVMHRAQQSGVVYAETDVFQTHTGTEWVAIRINHPNGGAIYDSTADGALMRGNGDLAIPWSAGADASIGAGDLSGAPQDSSERVALGIHSPGGGLVELYVNRVLRQTFTGCTARVGTHIAIGVYNGGAGHFHKVREYDALPF